MTGRLLRQQDLSIAQRDAMFAMLAQHFTGVFRAQFDRDLSEKNWVVLIEQSEALVGFSTLLAYQKVIDGEAFTIIYSGDTIISPAAWGSMAFPKAWILSIYELRKEYPNGRLLWLLLTSGFRTYRFLPVFWSNFYPRHDAATPDNWQRIIHQLATERFGEQFDPTCGIVRFAHPQQLGESLRDVPAGKATDPHVAFFLARNPEHLRGDELVCVTDLEPDNLTPAGRRVVYGAQR